MLNNPKRIVHSTFILTFVVLLSISFWCLVFPIAVLLQSLPINPRLRKFIHIYTTQFVGMFIESIITFVQIFGGVKLIDYAVDDHLERLNKHENALIISNHPTLFDWMYMWGFLARYSKVAHFKVILKQDAQYVPFLGYAMQLAMYLFLARNWALDRANFFSILEYYQRYAPHYKILVFPEGTNLGSHSIPKGAQFIEKNKMKPLKETLPPRTTGFVELFMKMSSLNQVLSPPSTEAAKANSSTNTSADKGTVQEESSTTDIHPDDILITDILDYVHLFSSIDAVYNFTLAYNPSRSNAEMSIPAGKFPLCCHLLFERFDILELIDKVWHMSYEDASSYYETPPPVPSPEDIRKRSAYQQFSEKLAIWLTKVFYEKDAILHQFYTAPSARLLSATRPPLLSPENLIVTSNPSFDYTLVSTIASTLILSSFILFCYQNVWYYGYLSLGWSVISIIVLTIAKFSLYSRQLVIERETRLHKGSDESLPTLDDAKELLREYSIVRPLCPSELSIHNAASEEDSGAAELSTHELNQHNKSYHDNDSVADEGDTHSLDKTHLTPRLFRLALGKRDSFAIQDKLEGYQATKHEMIRNYEYKHTTAAHEESEESSLTSLSQRHQSMASEESSDMVGDEKLPGDDEDDSDTDKHLEIHRLSGRLYSNPVFDIHFGHVAAVVLFAAACYRQCSPVT